MLPQVELYVLKTKIAHRVIKNFSNFNERVLRGLDFFASFLHQGKNEERLYIGWYFIFQKFFKF